MTSNNKLPLHTRLGPYAAILLLAVICLLMLRNCVKALYYGGITSDREVSRFYKKGFVNGREKIGNSSGKLNEGITNPLLLKMYQKGFRDGRDSEEMKGKKRKHSKKGKK